MKITRLRSFHEMPRATKKNPAGTILYHYVVDGTPAELESYKKAVEHDGYSVRYIKAGKHKGKMIKFWIHSYGEVGEPLEAEMRNGKLDITIDQVIKLTKRKELQELEKRAQKKAFKIFTKEPKDENALWEYEEELKAEMLNEYNLDELSKDELRQMDEETDGDWLWNID
jgi:hypothetical protein